MRVLVGLWLLLLSLPAIAAASTPSGLVGRWISTRIDPTDPRTGRSAGWDITFTKGSRFTLERDEGFGVVAHRPGTYRVKGRHIVLRIDGFPSKKPVEEQFDHEIEGDNLHLTGESLRVQLTRSRLPNPALATLPPWPKTIGEGVQVLRTTTPQDQLARLGRMRKTWVFKATHFGLQQYIRNAFGLWWGNRDLWHDLAPDAGSNPDEAYDAERVSGVFIARLWDELTADIQRPAHSTDESDPVDPEQYFDQVAAYVGAAKERTDTRPLLLVPVWFLKDRLPRDAARIAESTPPRVALIARARGLVATEGPLTYLALLYLTEFQRTPETIALAQRYLDSDRVVFWPQRVSPQAGRYEDFDDTGDYQWGTMTLGDVAAFCLADLNATE